MSSGCAGAGVLMPATPNEIERHYTQPEDDDRVTCPDCKGTGGYDPVFNRCEWCDGTGYIDLERAAEDAAEAHGDMLMEMARDAAIERATGFEE